MKKTILSLIIIMIFLITGCGSTHEELEKECIRLGYENLTDYKIETRFDWVNVGQIECDNKVIWTECYHREKYKWDKWGDYKVIDRVWECNKGRWDHEP